MKYHFDKNSNKYLNTEILCKLQLSKIKETKINKYVKLTVNNNA